MADSQYGALWQQALELLKQELSKATYDTWIKNTQLLAIENSEAKIAVPNDLAKDFLSSRYENFIKRSLSIVTGENISLQFISPSQSNSSNTTPAQQPKSTNAQSLTHQLNPKYTFDTFVVGNSNRFAHAASLAVAESPAKNYNPLFIYGGVGLGKTHLMHAIGHHVASLQPNARIVYASSEKFTNELINAILDGKKTADFRNRYRNVDVLLIDDIQFLAGKERTQEEFFHTFNALHEADKQIIISSDRPPKEIPTLEDRLRSRFEWGLITDIQAPDLETRIAILRKKAMADQIEGIPDELMTFIATKIQSNIRELEGALNRILAFSSLSGKPISIETANEALKDVYESKTQPITILSIQECVGRHFGLKVEDFKAKKRTRNVAFPRQIAMYLCRELTDFSLPKIGEAFGGRDHTTVIHAHEKINSDIKNVPDTELAIQNIKEKLIRGE